ncbi:MAG: ABC transporter ATP-binding protein [Acidobacteriota bacterium]|nr:ABC transporter ATP-binding protein [Acidobacteriota bacterium]MDE3092169.1 ABC transporter ATP-binding protein [Acidobacteriota bacterium]MDE3139364.1 ABC transporter ATP-binding protein [Acidobacteriota bacterium]
MTLALRVEHLRKSYGAVAALDDVSFEVERGEVFALLGPNGAGKTTSIEILEGFIARDAGSVEVLGIDPGDRQHLRGLRDRIGVVLQELAVESFFTVRQVLERNAGFYPHPRDVEEVIDMVGLSEKSDAKVKRLSGGQQRRLDIGLGIVGNPELLFLDEPTTGLDPAARRTTWDLIRHLAAEGTTVLMSSHYMNEIEALAQRVAVLSHGRVAALGATATLGGRDRSEATIRFTLPSGVAASDLPITPWRVEGDTVEVRSDDELRALHALTSWALEGHIAVTGLSVARETLEDIYLALTRGDRAEIDEEPDDTKARTP